MRTGCRAFLRITGYFLRMINGMLYLTERNLGSSEKLLPRYFFERLYFVQCVKMDRCRASDIRPLIIMCERANTEFQYSIVKIPGIRHTHYPTLRPE